MRGTPEGREHVDTGTRSFPRQRRRNAITPMLLGWIVLACSCGDAERTYDVRGVVESVRAEDRQLIISHEDVPGLMPAMTMNFDVADPSLLEGVSAGDAIRFELLFTGRAYVVRALERVGDGRVSGAWPDLARAEDPVPNFSLANQRGEQIETAALRGKVVLIDFVYTHCPGPCPILTGVDVAARRQLEDIGDRIVFCSITLDPERDDSDALAGYAKARGAEFDNWHFLTGEADVVHALIRDFGVASSAADDGEIDHMVARFLVDSEGRIVKRYLGMTHTAEDIAGDIRRVVDAEG